MKVLIGCECYGKTRDAFLKLGYDAYSCDLKSDRSGNTDRHIEGDIFSAIKYLNPDLLIVHPPCTFVAGSGERWMSDERYPERALDREKAVNFAYSLWASGVKHIAIENPVGALST